MSRILLEAGPAVPDPIRAFFDAMCGAFNRMDAAAVAAHYDVPSGIAQGGRSTHWGSLEAIRADMAALIDAYRRRGCSGASCQPQAFIPQGSGYAVADVQWRIDWEGEAPPWIFKTTYNLIRTEDGWRILLCTAYEEDLLVAGGGP